MVGQGGKSAAKLVQKAAYKVKVVKPGKKLVPKVQTNLDSFAMQGSQVIADNSSVDVDCEAYMSLPPSPTRLPLVDCLWPVHSGVEQWSFVQQHLAEMWLALTGICKQENVCTDC